MCYYLDISAKLKKNIFFFKNCIKLSKNYEVEYELSNASW